MPAITGNTNLIGPKVVAVAGSSGSVSGTSVAGPQSVTLFTTPANPTDVEYLVDIGYATGGTPNANMGSTEGSVGSPSGAAQKNGNRQMRVGANQAVAFAMNNEAATAYVINYRSIGYRAP